MKCANIKIDSETYLLHYFGVTFVFLNDNFRLNKVTDAQNLHLTHLTIDFYDSSIFAHIITY